MYCKSTIEISSCALVRAIMIMVNALCENIDLNTFVTVCGHSGCGCCGAFCRGVYETPVHLRSAGVETSQKNAIEQGQVGCLSK